MATDKDAVYNKDFADEEIRRHSAVGSVDLNKNLDARVSNPLADIPYEELLHDVEVFAREKGLEDKLELLQRGALIAQDPANFEALDLEEDEKDAIRHENAHKWSHPWKLYFTIIVCSIGAAVQGWDQTGSASLIPMIYDTYSVDD
ncbi:hypothetical protein LTR17_011945 [Elasticomyces elasticus]|nr:hypothetical protein LTR17_011945 [Elasticomyces elasticus]